MKILSAMDSIFRVAAEYEPWFPQPDTGVRYGSDEGWQQAHLWDHHYESNGTNFHGPFRGPSILHHPDYQYAVDNGWRPIGGSKAIEHQSRGETSSGSPYLYKIGKDGIIHQAHLAVGPEETGHFDDDETYMGPGSEHGGTFEDAYGTVPHPNWRHLITTEGATAENPSRHDSLRDLVDDELARSADPANGYKDFEPLPVYRSENRDANKPYDDFEKRHQNAIRRAWETGTNNPYQHFNDPIEDPYADIEQIPRNMKRESEPPRGDTGGSRHPRYGGSNG